MYFSHPSPTLAFEKGNNKVEDVNGNFVILSTSQQQVRVTIYGSNVEKYDMYRTSDGSSGDNYKYIGRMNTTQIDTNCRNEQYIFYVEYT